MMKDQYDCIVMGGGPAGSTAAALIAAAGFSTLLVEREAVPRFHVGESLMPECYWTLERLGLLERMRTSDFVKKGSVQFVSHTGKESQPFFFREHDPRECSQTWQVERADFDKLLFDNAAEKGAECRDRTRVLSVLFEGSRAPQARPIASRASPPPNDRDRRICWEPPWAYPYRNTGRSYTARRHPHWAHTHQKSIGDWEILSWKTPWEA